MLKACLAPPLHLSFLLLLLLVLLLLVLVLLLLVLLLVLLVLLLLLLLLLFVFLPRSGRGWQGRWLGLGWGCWGGRLRLQLPFSRTYFPS